MSTIRLLFLVAGFGAAGAVARFTLSELVHRWLGRGLPVGTLVVNCLGCFLLGAVAESALAAEVDPGPWRNALAIGFLGGLTTFSTFGHETFRHLQQGNLAVGVGNVLLSVTLGLAAVWAGVATVKVIYA